MSRLRRLTVDAQAEVPEAARSREGLQQAASLVAARPAGLSLAESREAPRAAAHQGAREGGPVVEALAVVMPVASLAVAHRAARPVVLRPEARPVVLRLAVLLEAVLLEAASVARQQAEPAAHRVAEPVAPSAVEAVARRSSCR